MPFFLTVVLFVGLAIAQFVTPVGREPSLLGVPQIAQHTDRSFHQLGQVAFDMSRMFAGQADFSGEAEVVAHEHPRPAAKTDRETPIGGVADSDGE